VGNGEGFIGSIDEVRISSVMRAANEMMFGTPPPAIVPHTPDEFTLHLWHFDEAAGSTNGMDAVAVNSITLTNFGLPSDGLYTNISLGNPSFTGLGSALRITSRNAYADGGTFTDATQFTDPTTGAFTLEAIIKPEVNPLAPPNNMAIIYGDRNGALGDRGWQFRISGRQLELNVLAGNSSDANPKVDLPESGPNAAVAGQWYHVAITYEGTATGVLKFYWTALDPNQTEASLLMETTMPRTLGGQPTLGIGGSARTVGGVGNGEGFIGSIDEVRISSIAREAGDMIASTGATAVKPKFTLNPQTNTLVGFGRTLTLSALASGTPPISYQWQLNGANLSGMVDNQLVISNVTFNVEGSYQLVATNAFGSTTSKVAQVTAGAAFTELYATAIDANGTLMEGGEGIIDPHYTLWESSDPNNLGPNAIAWADAYPLANKNGLFANYGPNSQWIGTVANGGSGAGQYVFRTTFLLDSTVPATASLEGTWWLNSGGIDILLNGSSIGPLAVDALPLRNQSTFSVASGFTPGLNTMDFVITNASAGAYPQPGLRVELQGIGQALPPGLPVITNQPVSRTVRESGKTAFSVVALGRPPLSYQWWYQGAPLTGATNRTLNLNPVNSGPNNGNYSVVVRNDSGSVTSQVAVLTVVANNQSPVVTNLALTTGQDVPLTFSMAKMLQNASDPDGDAMSVISIDITSTKNGTVEQAGAAVTYTPPAGITGTDRFSYIISDDQGGTTTGYVNLTIAAITPPSLSIGAGTNRTLRIAWPATAASFVLQVSSSLPGNFADAGLPTTTEGIETVVYVTPAESARFYQLIRR
jgi:hypothetical protein